MPEQPETPENLSTETGDDGASPTETALVRTTGHHLSGGDALTEADEKTESIIRSHMGLAILGAAIPIPLLDLTAVTAVQLDMLKRLARAHDAPFDARSSRTFVTSLSSALAGGAAARSAASLVKLIPGFGTVTGAMTQMVVTGASTYAVGRLFGRLFAEGRPLEDLRAEDFRDEARSYFERGAELARLQAEKPSAVSLLDAIERLHDLRDGESTLRERGIERQTGRFVSRLRSLMEETPEEEIPEIRRRLARARASGSLEPNVVDELEALLETRIDTHGAGA